uniref:Uncharacterized protein n=1 Tax=Anguilla anguilla TaxID=7936 RepID=A0A0E9ST99_ANGAN
MQGNEAQNGQTTLSLGKERLTDCIHIQSKSNDPFTCFNHCGKEMVKYET